MPVYPGAQGTLSRRSRNQTGAYDPRMASTILTERYADQIAGVLSCYDRILICGTLPKICYARGMTFYLYEKNMRIFDYPRFAQPFRDQLRENAEHWASEHGIKIEHIRKKNFRKEDRIK